MILILLFIDLIQLPPFLTLQVTVLRLAFVRDFGGQNCQPTTKLQLKN